MNRQRRVALFACAAMGCFLIGSLPAVAAEVTTPSSGDRSPGANSNVIEEIVVTATRREENLRDVPVAVTAVTGATLQQRQISDIGALQHLAPSLTAAPFGDGTSPILSMRGLVQQDIVSAVDPAVGVYLDGVYLGRATGGNLSFIDTQRVEVLRGPQGTLFGRNTIGGAISITPNQPTDRFEGSISGNAGNYKAYGATGVLNVPLTDRAAMRLVLSHRSHDGYARSAINGADLNAQNLTYARASLKAQLSDSWQVLVAGDFTDSKNDGEWITLLKTFPPAEAIATRVTGGRQTAAQFVGGLSTRPFTTTGPVSSRNWGVGGTLTGDLDAVHFKSITAYREVRRRFSNFDQDSTPFQLIDIAYSRTDQHQFSQEFQLFGKAMGERLDWIVGAYYFKETGRDAQATHTLYPTSPNYNVSDALATNRNVAVYGQVTYALTDTLAAVAGIRYTKDKRQVDLFTHSAGVTPDATIACSIAGAVLPTCRVSLAPASFSYKPFTLGLNYKPSETTLLYAKWSRGFRSGGFNTRGASTSVLLSFEPEKLDSYEAGAKLLIDRRFSLNVAAFYSKYHGIQTTANLGVINGASVSLTQNSGAARIEGVEMEGEAVFGQLRLTGSLALTDAKYINVPANVVGITIDSPLNYTPKTNLSVAADYTIPQEFGNIVLHADYVWRSRTYFVASPPAEILNSQAAYGLLDASITARLNNNMTLSVFGKNLTDKRYLERTTNLVATGFINGYPGDPQTYGVSVGYNF